MQVTRAYVRQFDRPYTVVTVRRGHVRYHLLVGSFSRIATKARPTATPEPLSVCSNTGLPFCRVRACIRRA